MTESAAICEYLVSRYGPSPLAVTVNEPAYGAYLNWLHFGEATLTFPQTIYFRYSILEPDEKKNPQAAADYARWFLARLLGRDADGGGDDLMEQVATEARASGLVSFAREIQST